jgi:hypothetical protein
MNRTRRSIKTPLVLVALLLGAAPAWAAPCGPTESACEQGVVANCDCGGDPCLQGEHCAAAAHACPPAQGVCRALLAAVTTTTTTSTTTTTLHCKAAVPVPFSIISCGCFGVARYAQEFEEYEDVDGDCMATGGRIDWECPGQPPRSGTYSYDAPGIEMNCTRRQLIASANCGCVPPTTGACGP